MVGLEREGLCKSRWRTNQKCASGLQDGAPSKPLGSGMIMESLFAIYSLMTVFFLIYDNSILVMTYTLLISRRHHDGRVSGGSHQSSK